MRTFRVFRDTNGRERAVKQGWSWLGFFFGSLWALFSGLWVIGAVMLPVELLLTMAGGIVNDPYAYDPYNPANPIILAILLIPLGIRIIFGCCGNGWKAAALERQGFSEVASLKATGKAQAISLAREEEAALVTRPMAAFAAIDRGPEIRPEDRPEPPRFARTRDDTVPAQPSASPDTRSTDTFRLILAALIGGAVCLTGVGLVPAGILLLGLAMALKSGRPGPLKTATGLVSGFGLVLLILSTGAGIVLTVLSSTSDPDASTFSSYSRMSDLAMIAFGVAGLALAAVLALHHLWLSPLLRQFDAIRAGLLGVRLPKPPQREPGQKIMSRDGLQTYSVADELAKWHALRGEGVIDEDEYQKARSRLLKTD
jgi:hypothetical protein